MLGPLELVVEGESTELRGTGERALLVLLLLDAGRVVPADRLIDALWGKALPANPLNALQARVSRLRSTLAAVGVPSSSVAARPRRVIGATCGDG